MIYHVRFSVYADENGDCNLCPARYNRNGERKPCPFDDGTINDGTRRKECIDADITDILNKYEINKLLEEKRRSK